MFVFNAVLNTLFLLFLMEYAPGFVFAFANSHPAGRLPELIIKPEVEFK